MKRIKIPSLKDQCDAIWSDCIKIRAGYKSELSGNLGKQIGGESVIAAHHIMGKNNYRLRYELDNGICLINASEHVYGVHSHNPAIAAQYIAKILNVIGAERYEKLKSLCHNTDKSNLKDVKFYLEQKKKGLLNGKRNSNNA